MQARRDQNIQDVAIIRVEQLYPFPHDDLVSILQKFVHAKKVVWCQEEPQNQGVWFASQHNIEQCLGSHQKLIYVGGGFAAAPAAGSAVVHAAQQAELVNEALVNA